MKIIPVLNSLLFIAGVLFQSLFPINNSINRQQPVPKEFRFDQAVFSTGTQNTGAIIQDRDGFLWLGTMGRGLVRYDGYEAKVYSGFGQKPLPDLFVRGLFEDREGWIWIVTANGLSRFDKDTNQFTTYPYEPSNPDTISSDNWGPFQRGNFITQDNNGDLWFGSMDGLNVFNKTTGKFKRIKHDPDNPNSLADNQIQSVILDHSGNIWLGLKDAGVDRLDPKTGVFTHYVYQEGKPDGLGSKQVSSLLEDKAGRIWIGTFDKGLYVLNPQDGSIKSFQHDPNDPQSLASNKIKTLFMDREGNVWVIFINMEQAGVSLFNPSTQKFHTFKNEPNNPFSISSSMIVGLFQDHSGIIWMINDTSVIDKLDPQKPPFKIYRHDPNNPNSINGKAVISTYEDRQGLLWVNTEAGFSSVDKKSGEIKNYLTNGYYPRIYQDKEGVYWLGGCCAPGSFYQFDPVSGKTTKTYSHDPNNPDSLADVVQINYIAEDPHNPDILYLSTNGAGVEKFDKKTGKFVHGLAGQEVKNSWLLFFDTQGYLWITSWGQGVRMLDTQTGKLTTYQNDPARPESISSDTVNSGYEDRDGTLWFGTAVGLDRFDKKSATFKHYKEDNGYLINNAGPIGQDAEGILWVGSISGSGLARLDPQTEKMKIFKAVDGLQSDVFYPLNGTRDRDGEMWFGGPGGLMSFYPEEIKDNSYIPPVLITALKQGGDPLNLPTLPERTQEITLDWQHNYFEFEFAGLNFSQSMKNQYQYKLEGIDQDWFNSGTKRYGRYSGLPGGDYILKIKASNNDGVWNEKGVELKVKVIPPFWQTPWFMVLCGLLLVGAVVGVYTWRLRWLQIEKDNAQKFSNEMEEKVKQRTAELAEVNIHLAAARDEAEIASRAKSDFLANMSHELRTPLNGILGYAQILKNDPAILPKQAHGLDIIQENGEHLLGLINDVLDLSKIEAQRLELLPHPTHLPMMLQKAVSLFEIRAVQKKLDFIFDTPTQLPTGVMVDEKRLRQVINNLLSNAIKFTDEGSVTFKICQTGVEKDNNGNDNYHLKFEVIDTGPGLSEIQIQQLFKAFGQVGSKEKRAEGTGLGLALSRRLVQAMGGDLQVTSTPGKGCNFWFEITLPASNSNLQSALSIYRGLSGYTGSRKKILMVDDKRVNRAVLLDLLSPLGFDLEEASSGAEALEKVKVFKPDLMLIDLVMPKMSGFEAVQHIRAIPGHEKTPLLAVSASVFDEDQQSSLLAGFDGFIPKPIIADQLISYIGRLLNLEWVYKESKEAAQTGEIVSTDIKTPDLSPAEILALFNLAKQGDINGIIEYADRLISLDNQNYPFAHKLKLMAKQFETEEIIEFLKQHWSPPE